MKKLGLLVMPLMAVSLLASCGGKPGLDEPKPLEDCSWETISQVSKAGKAKEWFHVGNTKTVRINNQIHEVRIIGFNQDKDKDGNGIGITFEFVNLISDSNGYSLVTQWNDTNDLDTANHNYLDSSVRKALTNEGKGHILWAQKGETAWSTNPNYDGKSILDMLPKDLKDVLVAPQKTVQCYENGEWTNKPIINNDGEYDKLFLLSGEEMGSNSSREGAYTYYQKPDISKLNFLRIKKQVEGNVQYVDDDSWILYSTRQIYQDKVHNSAGYNFEPDITGGGNTWLRNPDEDNLCAYLTLEYGDIGIAQAYNNACPVAPAFCI